VHDIQPYLKSLASQTHADSGWGYRAGRAVHLEPTCLTLLAFSLASADFNDWIDRGRRALAGSRTADGSYRLNGDREEAIWPTALVLFVQAATGFPAEDIERTASRLLSWQGRKPDDTNAKEVHDIDLNLIGWPWAEGNFSWVEPTAWACLALRRAGHGAHPRVEEGLRLLLDRAFDEGGINYGNRQVLGRQTDPIPGPTALMLLALQGRGDHPRVRASIRYLLNEAKTDQDIEHLCWIKLALACHTEQSEVREALPALDHRIVEVSQIEPDAGWQCPTVPRLALTALALGATKANPFQLVPGESSEQRSPLAPPALKVHRQGGGRKSWSERLSSSFRGLAVHAASRLRQLPPQTRVHIARANDYNGDLSKVLDEQYQAFRQHVPLAGKRVVLKPNIVEYHRNKVINTDPRIVAAVIELCRREGAAEVVVAEGPGHWRNVEYLVRASGMADVLRHYKAPFTDLNHDEPVKTPNLGRLTGLEYLYLARTVATADVLISLPKLKTHHWAGATLSLKNLFGTLPGICYGWPKNELHWRGIHNSIVDIALTRTPDLAIVDGIIGMEGDGPLNGTAKPFGALIMGCDPLAVDATCCRLMQLDPEKIGYLVLGYQKRLGLLHSAQIEQVGEPLSALSQPFATVPHFEELRLARSA
jgi:uncharacterized protein (DUF362 family)